jgi:hypothetical protein
MAWFVIKCRDSCTQPKEPPITDITLAIAGCVQAGAYCSPPGLDSVIAVASGCSRYCGFGREMRGAGAVKQEMHVVFCLENISRRDLSV